MPMYDHVRKYVYRLESRKCAYLVYDRPLEFEELQFLIRAGIRVDGKVKPQGTSIEDLIEIMERNNERNG